MSDLPPQIKAKIQECKDKQLKKLNLRASYSNYQLTEIPEEIFNLEHLEILDLTGNIVRNISKKIVNLPRLKSLNLSYNQLEKIPE